MIDFFKWQSMIDKKHILSEIPDNTTLYKRIFNIAWPSALESIALAMIGAVDMMMVGSLGANAIASVGINNQPKFLFLAPVSALNIAVTVLVARRKGENDRLSAVSYLKTSLATCLFLSLIVSIVAIIFSKEILIFAGANPDYLNMAVNYFRIIMFGNIFYALALTVSAAQRSVGQTKISLKINLVANLINLIFNAVLINGINGYLQLGVIGAAIATVIGNFAAMLIAFKSINIDENFLNVQLTDKYFDKQSFKNIIKIVKMSFFEQLFLKIGFLMYSKGVAGLGTVEFASHQVVMNVMHISFALGDGLSIATSSLVGQTLGAKRSDLAIIYGKISQRIGLFIAIIASLTTILFRVNILRFFTNDILIINTAFIPMIILSVCIIFQIPQVIIIGSLRGAGDVKFIASLMLISVTIIRPFLTYILCYPLNMGLIGAWLSVLLDQLTRNLVSYFRFKQAKWINIKA